MYKIYKKYNNKNTEILLRKMRTLFKLNYCAK